MIQTWYEGDNDIGCPTLQACYTGAQMNAEAKGQLYDVLIALGQQTLDYYNPCDWQNRKCRRMRSSEDDKGCCVESQDLGVEGCTVKSLGCKLWLCEGQRNLFRECEIELRVLRQVADSCGIPYQIKRSKEEDFTLSSFQPFP